MSQKIQVKYFLAILILTFSTTTLVGMPIPPTETPVIEWTRQLGTCGLDDGIAVSVDSSGNAYVTGRTWGDLGGTNAGSHDVYLVKYDTNGTKLWTEQLGTTAEDRSYNMSVDSDGNAYITGYTYGSLDGNPCAGYADMFLTKYDTNGTKLWTEQLGTADKDYGNDVSVDGSGNVYVTGLTHGNFDGNTSAGDADMFLVKYNANGTKLWTKQLGSVKCDYGTGISVDTSGNAYVTGFTAGNFDGNTNAGGDGDMFLVKYDTNGTKLWTELLGTSELDGSFDVSIDADGNAYVSGSTRGNLDGNINAGWDDMFLVKYDTNGNKLWTEQLGTNGGQAGLGVSVDANGNAYVTGFTFGDLDGNTSAGTYDMFLVKYDTNGAKLWTEQLGTIKDDRGNGVSADGSGNVYVTGWTYGGIDGNTSAGNLDMFLVKYSTVPEPTTITLILVGLLTLAVFWCRR